MRLDQFINKITGSNKNLQGIGSKKMKCIKSLMRDVAKKTIETVYPHESELGTFYGCNANDIYKTFIARFEYKAKEFTQD